MTYTLLAIDGERKILPYAGIPLRNCDIISASVDVDVIVTTITTVAYVACNTTDLQITAKAEYVWSNIPSLETTGLASPGGTFFNSVRSVAGGLVGFA